MAPNNLEAAIAQDLRKDRGSYQDIADRHGVSRGKVWTVARSRRLLKNQVMRDQRAHNEKERQIAEITAMVQANLKGNCLQRLQELKPNSVMLFCTSIPFNLSKPYGDDPSLDSEPYMVWRGKMITALGLMERALAPGGVMFVEVGVTRNHFGKRVPIDSILHREFEDLGLTWQNRPAWTRRHGITVKGRLAERYESVLIFTKGDRPLHFNENAVRIPQDDPGKRGTRGPRKGKLTGNPLGAYPSDVLDFTPVKAGHGEKTEHPCQFPTALARFAVLLYTAPGDLVADPFAGSGTTLVAAKQLERAFWGCDLHYQALRDARLNETAPDDSCRLPGVTERSISVWQAEASIIRYDPQQRLPMEG